MRWVSVVLLCTAAGCAQRMGHFSIVSTHPATAFVAAARTHDAPRTVRGESCRKYLLFVPLSPMPDLEDAYLRAIAAAPGADALAEVSVRTRGLFTLVYNERCLVVEGTPVRWVRPVGGDADGAVGVPGMPDPAGAPHR
ncbi:hypothetical protein [Anaeromyxobacter terrae]|uniref:hypothetical protein n=1 Tax=Anaeromyxobacter terrae TaxID=2925406 RepID=UPI001F56D4A7|nr:hypothetical protein [Anaeromyxobacter sp. SG22]